MKQRVKYVMLLVCLVIAATTSAKAQTDAKNDSVYVVIDFGKAASEQVTKAVKWTPELTALIALQHCADISTHPAGEDYIFVESINKVANVKYKHAWYYKINDVSPRVLAYKQLLQPGDTLKWIYKTDICSKK